MALVDHQIITMLTRYYENKTIAYYKFNYLSALVNQPEITGDQSSDIKLVRERIVAILEDKNCDINKQCYLPAEAIQDIIRQFVYM